MGVRAEGDDKMNEVELESRITTLEEQLKADQSRLQNDSLTKTERKRVKLGINTTKSILRILKRQRGSNA